MTDEQVERVARAIHAARQLAGYSGQAAWEYEPADIQALYRLTARAAIAAMGQDPELEALRELGAAYAGGEIVGFRTRFRTNDDQDQTLINASGEELATTYSEDTARFISAATNYVRLKLQDAPPADPRVKEGG